MKQIDSGAEAILYQDNDKVLKERIPKTYRINTIDDKLRKSRTKREKKILEKLHTANLKVPKTHSGDKYTITMDHIDGIKLRDCYSNNIKNYSEQIGEFLAKMHDLDIVHGDLTTSNMISKDNTIYFIDFGLSAVSIRHEDKAVDLHILKQALESYHHDFWKEAYNIILNTYENNSKNAKETLKRLIIVEKRGRNKH